MSHQRHKLDANVRTLVLGDSHIQLAIDCRHAGSCCINSSINAESTYFTYYRLKKFLRLNPQLTDVYLGFSYHNLSAYYHDFITGPYSENIASRYFTLLPLREQVCFLQNSARRIPYFLKDVLKYNLIELNYGYRNRFDSTHAQVDEMHERLQSQYYDTSGHLHPFSDLNIRYLKKTVQLCQQEGVELYLLSTPVHPYYESLIPRAYKLKYQNLLQELDAKLIDFSSLALDDTCFAPDGDHLSVKGADRVSSHFVALLPCSSTR